MDQLPPKGIPRRGIDAAFEADEARKSRLILEGHALREQKQHELAAAKFAEAATIEEQLAARCEELALSEKSLIHRFSAVSCWAQAGNFYAAIALGDELLARTDLPVRLREQAVKYVNTLRNRRSEWYHELLHAAGHS